MSLGRLITLLLLAWVSATPGWTQHYAQLFGQVTDVSQAGITDAVVTVVDEDTGVRRQVMTEAGGMYAVGSLAPGSYKITVRKEGFGSVVQFGVKLSGATPVRLNFRLPLSSFTDSITVIGTAPQLERPDASTGGQFDLDHVSVLPLNGSRGVLTLMELVPGTSVVPATRGDAGQFSTNGMRANTNYFSVDGVSANVGVAAGGLPAQSTGGAMPALSAFGSLDSIISLEAMQEFRLQTSTTVAEFGRMPGAAISMASRSGSEQFHGATSLALRNYQLNANDWFANRWGLGRSRMSHQDFSQTLGGPLRRHHTFFFLSFQHIGLTQPYVFEQAVPSQAARSALLSTVQPVVNFFPQPNGPLFGATGYAAWLAGYSRPAGLTAGSARFDQSITPRMMLFGRYSDSPSHNQYGTPEVNHLNLRTQSLTVGANARLNARSVLDLRVNETQSTANSLWTDSTSSDVPGCALQPLVSAVLPLKTVTCDFLVRFTINGVGQVMSGNEGERRERQFQIVQTASLERGSHAIKAGVDYRRLLAIRRRVADSVGFAVSGVSGLNNFPRWWYSDLTAIPDESVRIQELSLWLQDTWQIGKRLTVAGGMRWEFSPPPPLTVTLSFLDFGTGAILPDPARSLWPAKYGDFAPRLGVTFRLDHQGQTVLRAGGGLYYDSSVSIATEAINNGPLNGGTLKTIGGGLAAGNISYGFVPNLQLPQVLQWNVALEHGFGTHDVVSLGYVGSTANHLLRTEMSNALNTGKYVVLTTNRAGSDYNALQLQYRRHVAAGLDVAASYGWSHSLDSDSSDAFLFWSGVGSSPRNDHASSDFDVRHAMNAALSYEFRRRKRSSGWSLDAIVRARSGFPITILDEEATTGLALANAFRPNWVYGQPLWLPDNAAPGGKTLNPAAFALAPAPVGAIGAQGNLGRNVTPGFGMWQLDLAVRHEFRLSERFGLQLRVDGFNALNHTNFGDPVRFLNSPLFGLSTSLLNMELGTGSPGSGLAPALQTGGPRALQVGMRFHF